MRRFVTPIALFLGLLWSSPALAQEAPLEEARRPVEHLYAVLLEAMKGGDSLGFDERQELIAPAVDTAYDMAFMASKALGRHWRGLPEDKRQAWHHTFRALTIHTYAARFDGYSGQEFEVGAVTPASRGTAVVNTRILSPGEEPAEIRYRMRPQDGGWRIVDIYLNGTVSELALRRSEYAAVIEREGFEHLTQSLAEKTSKEPAAE